MEHTHSRLVAAVAAASVFVTGCSVYDTNLLPDENALLSDGRPPRPPGEDLPIDMELIFRISDVQLNSDVDWANTGRNLDGLNTTNENLVGQCTPPEGPRPPDGPGGIDNAMGQQLLTVIVEVLITCLEEELGNSHSAGEGTLMLWVRGWNGMADDPLVNVSMVVAADGTSADQEDVVWDSDNHRLVLASDGVTDAPDPMGDMNDVYYLRPDSFTGGSNSIPRLTDVAAYINAGRIVYEIPTGGRVPLNAGIGSLDLVVNDGLMIVEMNDGFSAIEKGVLSGRYALTALLDAGSSIGVCEGSQDYVEGEFEKILDVMSNPATPPNEELECDAMSFGIPFQGHRARFAIEDGEPARSGTSPPLPNACAAGTNPCAPPPP